MDNGRFCYKFVHSYIENGKTDEKVYGETFYEDFKKIISWFGKIRICAQVKGITKNSKYKIANIF